MKKETTLSVLKEIRDLLKRSLIKDEIICRQTEIVRLEDEKFITITFPDKTAKEIVAECGNELGKGKLLHITSWYENEYFYCKEKCRPGTRLVSKELIGLGKDWNECETLAKEEGGEMLNFAESVYFIQEYFKKTGEYPWNMNCSWTSSRSSYGRLVILGYGDVGGVYVDGHNPRFSDSSLGLCYQKTV